MMKNTLEVNQHKKLTAILNPESGEEIQYVAENWEEVEMLFSLFLEEDFEELQSKLVY